MQLIFKSFQVSIFFFERKLFYFCGEKLRMNTLESGRVLWARSRYLYLLSPLTAEVGTYLKFVQNVPIGSYNIFQKYGYDILPIVLFPNSRIRWNSAVLNLARTQPFSLVQSWCQRYPHVGGSNPGSGRLFYQRISFTNYKNEFSLKVHKCIY